MKMLELHDSIYTRCNSRSNSVFYWPSPKGSAGLVVRQTQAHAAFFANLHSDHEVQVQKVNSSFPLPNPSQQL